jgi:hypothetical protein
MLCGQSVSGIVVAVSYILKEFQYVQRDIGSSLFSFKLEFTHFFFEFSRENRDKVEIYLAFGATRVEACRPIAVQALKLALTPSINNMR